MFQRNGGHALAAGCLCDFQLTSFWVAHSLHNVVDATVVLATVKLVTLGVLVILANNHAFFDSARSQQFFFGILLAGGLADATDLFSRTGLQQRLILLGKHWLAHGGVHGIHSCGIQVSNVAGTVNCTFLDVLGAVLIFSTKGVLHLFIHNVISVLHKVLPNAGHLSCGGD